MLYQTFINDSLKRDEKLKQLEKSFEKADSEIKELKNKVIEQSAKLNDKDS